MAEDSRDITSPTYNPTKALVECLDLWESGAWSDSNAQYDLEEVMLHVGSLLRSPQDPGGAT